MDAEFWAWRGPGIKDWKTEYAPLPDNYHLLDPEKGGNQIPTYIDMDLIISQNPLAHFDISLQIAEQLGLPIINIHHTLPPPNFTLRDIKRLKKMLSPAIADVFISNYNREAWGYTDEEGIVIKHAIDSEFWCPDPEVERGKHVLSVVNDWINRDWCCGFNLWDQIIDFKNPICPTMRVGDTPGFSFPADGPEDLRSKYRESLIFINTSLVSPIPMSLLEAMSCGCACVSTNTCMIPEIIEHGVDGFIYDPKEPEMFKNKIQELLDKEDYAKEIGQNARKKIQEMFSKQNFINSWNTLCEEILGC
jgi:glycosyltransferase involved in cell wall biosynthesis